MVSTKYTAAAIIAFLFTQTALALPEHHTNFKRQAVLRKRANEAHNLAHAVHAAGGSAKYPLDPHTDPNFPQVPAQQLHTNDPIANYHIDQANQRATRQAQLHAQGKHADAMQEHEEYHLAMEHLHGHYANQHAVPHGQSPAQKAHIAAAQTHLANAHGAIGAAEHLDGNHELADEHYKNSRTANNVYPGPRRALGDITSSKHAGVNAHP